jgi:hypothetical protein
MTTRTFKQRGQAYSSLPVTIVAKIDDVEVFNGVAPTQNTPYQLTGFDQEINWADLGNDLFSWTDDVTFSGSKTVEISVGDGYLVLMNTVANYPLLDAENVENQWSFVYSNQVDGVLCTNPWSNMTINGQAQNPNTEIPGQTYWLLPPNSTFSCTINITASMGSTAPG